MLRMGMVVVGVLVATIVLGALWLDEGEVVTLWTTDADSNSHHTQLWTVELDDVRYLRASTPRTAWLARLRERSLVRVESAGLTLHYRAIPVDDKALRTRVNTEMARKYGLADRLWGTLGDRSASIPIRLDPAEGLASARGDES
jgi:hypothetical protein